MPFLGYKAAGFAVYVRDGLSARETWKNQPFSLNGFRWGDDKYSVRNRLKPRPPLSGSCNIRVSDRLFEKDCNVVYSFNGKRELRSITLHIKTENSYKDFMFLKTL